MLLRASMHSMQSLSPAGIVQHPCLHVTGKWSPKRRRAMLQGRRRSSWCMHALCCRFVIRPAHHEDDTVCNAQHPSCLDSRRIPGLCNCLRSGKQAQATDMHLRCSPLPRLWPCLTGCKFCSCICMHERSSVCLPPCKVQSRQSACACAGPRRRSASDWRHSASDACCPCNRRRRRASNNKQPCHTRSGRPCASDNKQPCRTRRGRPRASSAKQFCNAKGPSNADNDASTKHSHHNAGTAACSAGTRLHEKTGVKSSVPTGRSLRLVAFTPGVWASVSLRITLQDLQLQCPLPRVRHHCRKEHALSRRFQDATTHPGCWQTLGMV